MPGSLSYFFQLRKKNSAAQKLAKDVEFLEKNKQHLEDLKLEFSEANARAQLLKQRWDTEYLAAIDLRHVYAKQLERAKLDPDQFASDVRNEVQWLTDDELQHNIETLAALSGPSVRDLSVNSGKSSCTEVPAPVSSDALTVATFSFSSTDLDSCSVLLPTLRPAAAADRSSNLSSLSEVTFVTCSSEQHAASSDSFDTSTTSHPPSLTLPKAATARGSKSASAPAAAARQAKLESTRLHKSWTIGTANSKIECLEHKLAELQSETGYTSTLTSLLTSQLKVLQDEIASLQAAMTFPPETLYHVLQTEFVPHKLNACRKELTRRQREVPDLKVRSIPPLPPLSLQELTIDELA